MLTVQPYKQHRPAVMHPNNVKSFTAALVPATAMLGHRRGKRGTRSVESRIARRSHVSKQESRQRRSRGLVGEPRPTRRKNQGGNLGKNLELSERRKALARKKRRKKRAVRKAARMKHQAVRARRWLEELMFGTFIVRTAALKGVNGIGHIECLLRICAGKGCDVIGLKETKRGGTSEIVAAGHRVYFSGDCSGVKGRKGQHGVGLAVKEEIVKKAGKDSITIKCISARLLKTRISIKSTFVTFVVAYAPTEDADEGENAKYMSALNRTVAPVPAREHVFVLTDANARTGKRGEGGGETNSKVLGAYGGDVLNENGKLLLRFAEDNKLALLNTFFCTPKNGVSYTFQSVNRGKDQARLDYILTKQADRRLVRCVNVRSPPLDKRESDHNLVYAAVHIPRRSAPNRRRRETTNATRRTTVLQRLMADPDLRHQVASAMNAALWPIPNGTCISDIAADMTDVMIYVSAEMAPQLLAPARATALVRGP